MIRNAHRGQATVELALALPVVAMLALVVAQAAAVAHRQVQVVHTAREAARAAAVADVAGFEEAARSAAEAAAGLDHSALDVAAHLEGRLVVVRIRYTDRTDLPLVGDLLPDLTLSATASMAWERAPPIP